MLVLHSPDQNLILAALPRQEFAPILDTLLLVQLPLGKQLFGPGEQLHYAYFPTTAIVSLQHVMQSGACAEVAGVGSEGIVGVHLYMGGSTTTISAVVQTAGYAYRIDRHLLMQEFNRAGKFQHLLLRYTQALITQIAQSVVCNRHHTLEQQLARWLLVTLDRIPSGELIMTQELVANTLGVRREGITQVAGKFQEAGYIRYRRGHISVLDRTGLETRSCECYGVVRQELQRLKQEAGR